MAAGSSWRITMPILIFACLTRLLSGAGMLESECAAGDSASCQGDQPAEFSLLARSAHLKHAVRPASKTTKQRVDQAQPRNNIAMVYLDQWRWDWAGFDDAIDVHMPTVKMLARRGTRFEHAYVPSPLCVPSRCALAAGKQYPDLSVKNNGYDYEGANGERSPTFMNVLQDAGYTTIVSGKDHLSSLSGVGRTGEVHAKQLGFDLFKRTMDKYEFCAGGMGMPAQSPSATEPYGVYLESIGKWEGQCRMYGPYGYGTACNMTPVCASPTGPECGFNCPKFNQIDEEDNIDAWVERSAEELLSTHWSSESKNKPWFLELGFPSPHPPFVSSAEAYANYGATKNFPPPIDADFNRSAPHAQHIDTLASQRQYAAMLGLVDGYLERFVNFLQSNGQFDNTVIILLSDHGEFLGDHAQYAKEAAWEQAMRVPLIFSGPGIAQNRLVNAPVATLDVTGTILDIAGTQPTDIMHTQSLLPVLQPSSSNLKPSRSVIVSGLDTGSGMDFMGKQGDFEMALKQFNETCILKLVCCLNGCIKQGTMFPTTDDVQVVLMRVEPGEGAARYEHNVLDFETGIGVPEANELLQSLSDTYRLGCSAIEGLGG